MCCTIARKQDVKILVKFGERSLWGRALECGRIGNVCHFRVDLDINTVIYVTHREIIKYSEDGEEQPWPRYKNDGQSTLF